MAGRKDDFSKQTVTALSERAGYRCSVPWCTNSTIGPSDESESAVSRSGMACHISAASSGPAARRYDHNMSSVQRRSIDNGIWMCYLHGKLIDTDFARYSVETLKKWRAVAERKAQLRQTHGEKITILPSMLRDIGLPSDNILLRSLGHENEEIGKIIDAAMVAELWGDNIAHAIRDECVELARNAFQHGTAREFRLTINPEYIQIVDDGLDFDVWRLHKMQGESGGIIATSHLIDCLKNRLLVVARRIDDTNETLFSFVDEAEDILDLTPCSVNVSWAELRRRELPYNIDQFCRSICIILPPYFSISDAVRLERGLKVPLDETRPIIFVLSKTSPKAIEMLHQHYPGCLTIGT